MDYKMFFDVVECGEEDKANARYYMDVRGIEEHLLVAEYLQRHKSGKVTYREVATALRYDKRIRRILYKFIGYLEERIRAYIANRYSDRIECLSLTQRVENGLAKKSLYEVLSEITLGQLILQAKGLPPEEKQELFSTEEIKDKNLDAIIALRNEVAHNRFLLHRSFRACESRGISGCTLYANIVNLYNHLPEDIRRSLASEINDSENFNENKWPHQTEWELAPQIVIKIPQEF